MLVGSFLDIFLIRWGPLFVTDVTVLKLAPIAKRCLVDNFPQGIIVTNQSGPQFAIDFWIDVAHYLL